GTGVANPRAAIYCEFVALGMAAKIIVVVEDQYPGAGLFLAEEMRRGQAADPAANDHEVVFFIRDRTRPGLAGHTSMHRLPGTIVAAAQAGFRRRIIIAIQRE